MGDSTGEVHSLKLSPNLRKQTREVKLALATKDRKRAGQLEVKKLANILGQDLRDGCLSSHSKFSSFLHIDYRQLCYRTYERQLTQLCRDFVEETCDK